MLKKQGTILGLMLGAVGLLLLGQVFSWLRDRPPETGTVQLCMDQPVLISGTVRTESVPVEAPQGDRWSLCVQPGQQVAAGQTLFQQQRPRELEKLALSVRVLRQASEVREPAVTRRSQLLEAVAALNSGMTAQRPALAEAAAALVWAERDRTALDADLEQAEARLLAYPAEQRETVAAGAAGIFTGSAVVTGERWYLETELPFAMMPGETLEAELLGGIFETVTLTAESVENGKTLLSCGQCLAQAAVLDRLTAKIFKDSESGLEIPARALYTVEEETGVYVVSGSSARWCPVTILRMSGDRAVVRPDRAQGLQPGDRVLLERLQSEGYA